MQPIESDADLEEALKAKRAVVFIEVGWSLNSVVVKRNLEEMIRKWRRLEGAPDVSFYVLDLTDHGQNKPPGIRQWVESVPAIKRSTYNAMGEMFWLRDGGFQEQSEGWISPEDLLKIAKACFMD
ncbi:MAG: hypothetical protein RIC55_01455 [Pirellulaceae bacterium]